MKKYSLPIVCAFLVVVFTLSSCKKSSSEFNFSTAITATFNGTTQQYVAPSGLVNYSPNYAIQGYETDSANNTVALLISAPASGTYYLQADSNNSLVIVQDGVSYSSSSSTGSTGGTAVVTVSGSKVTGTFSGTLTTATTPKKTLVVTNGIINTTY